MNLSPIFLLLCFVNSQKNKVRSDSCLTRVPEQVMLDVPSCLVAPILFHLCFSKVGFPIQTYKWSPKHGVASVTERLTFRVGEVWAPKIWAKASRFKQTFRHAPFARAGAKLANFVAYGCSAKSRKGDRHLDGPVQTRASGCSGLRN